MRLEHIAWTGGKPPKQDEARRRLEDEGYEVVCWNDPPGRTYTPHAHDRDECLWMLAGSMTFTITIDGTTYRLDAGDRLMLPNGVVHAAEAHAAGARYLIGER